MKRSKFEWAAAGATTLTILSGIATVVAFICSAWRDTDRQSWLGTGFTLLILAAVLTVVSAFLVDISMDRRVELAKDYGQQTDRMRASVTRGVQEIEEKERRMAFDIARLDRAEKREADLTAHNAKPSK